MRARGFTLLEILVAFAILVTGITLIATALRRHFVALQILETSLAAQQMAQEGLVREIVRRSDSLEIPSEPPDERFTPRLEVTSVPLETEPVRDLEVEQMTSEVSWTVRQQPRSLQVVAGFGKARENHGE